MNRQTTIKITVPNEERITVRQILAHMYGLNPRIKVELINSISSNGPTCEEIRELMEHRMKELGR